MFRPLLKNDTYFVPCAPLAQLDRAPDYGSGGRGFESSGARHYFTNHFSHYFQHIHLRILHIPDFDILKYFWPVKDLLAFITPQYGKPIYTAC